MAGIMDTEPSVHKRILSDHSDEEFPNLVEDGDEDTNRWNQVKKKSRKHDSGNKSSGSNIYSGSNDNSVSISNSSVAGQNLEMRRAHFSRLDWCRYRFQDSATGRQKLNFVIELQASNNAISNGDILISSTTSKYVYVKRVVSEKINDTCMCSTFGGTSVTKDDQPLRNKKYKEYMVSHFLKEMEPEFLGKYGKDLYGKRWVKIRKSDDEDTRFIFTWKGDTPPPEYFSVRYGLTRVRYKIEDWYPLRETCFKCQKFGHTQKYCPMKKSLCPLCSRDHSLKECPIKTDGNSSANKKCARCGMDDVTIWHLDCPVLVREKNKLKEKIANRNTIGWNAKSAKSPVSNVQIGENISLVNTEARVSNSFNKVSESDILNVVDNKIKAFTDYFQSQLSALGDKVAQLCDMQVDLVKPNEAAAPVIESEVSSILKEGSQKQGREIVNVGCELDEGEAIVIGGNASTMDSVKPYETVVPVIESEVVPIQIKIKGRPRTRRREIVNSGCEPVEGEAIIVGENSDTTNITLRSLAQIRDAIRDFKLEPFDFKSA